jgi:hypothetical protein
MLLIKYLLQYYYEMNVIALKSPQGRHFIDRWLQPAAAYLHRTQVPQGLHIKSTNSTFRP